MRGSGIKMSLETFDAADEAYQIVAGNLSGGQTLA